MSHMRTQEMIFFLGEEGALRWYLHHGCYPPVPKAFDICREAIQHVADDDGDHVVVNGDGAEMGRAIEIVTMLDLGPFVDAAQLVDDDE